MERYSSYTPKASRNLSKCLRCKVKPSLRVFPKKKGPRVRWYLSLIPHFGNVFYLFCFLSIIPKICPNLLGIIFMNIRCVLNTQGNFSKCFTWRVKHKGKGITKGQGHYQNKGSHKGKMERASRKMKCSSHGWRKNCAYKWSFKYTSK